MKRYIFLMISLVLIVVFLAACASQSPETPTEAPAQEEAAPEENSVEPSTESEPGSVEGPLTVLCGMQEDWCQAAVAAFEAETGIETSMVRMSSGEALARLQAEGADTQFDVWYGGPSLGPGAAKEEGLIEPYFPKNGIMKKSQRINL